MNTKKIDEIAILWNKTKDPKYKEIWYKILEAGFDEDVFDAIEYVENAKYETED